MLDPTGNFESSRVDSRLLIGASVDVEVVELGRLVVVLLVGLLVVVLVVVVVVVVLVVVVVDVLLGLLLVGCFSFDIIALIEALLAIPLTRFCNSIG